MNMLHDRLDPITKTIHIQIIHTVYIQNKISFLRSVPVETHLLTFIPLFCVDSHLILHNNDNICIPIPVIVFEAYSLNLVEYFISQIIFLHHSRELKKLRPVTGFYNAKGYIRIAIGAFIRRIGRKIYVTPGRSQVHMEALLLYFPDLFGILHASLIEI